MRASSQRGGPCARVSWTVIALVIATILVLPAAATARVPRGPAAYRVALDGATYSYSGLTDRYEVFQSFRRPGSLYVDPHPSRRRGQRSVGIFSGRPFIDASAGSVYFVTNTRAFRHVRSLRRTSRSRLDVASTKVGRSSLSATVRESRARQVTVALFHVRDTAFPFGSPTQILQGTLRLRFSRSGRRVRGFIDLYGNKLIEPGNSFPVDSMDATITGRRVR